MKIEEEIKQTKFKSARQKASLNILFTASWLSGQLQDFFKPYGITSQQFNILRILRGQHPNKISGTEIKSRMLDPHSDVSRLLDRLLTKQLILKSQCPNDKRAADILITDEGMQLLSQIDGQLDEADGALKRLSAKEAHLLSDLLDKARG